MMRVPSPCRITAPAQHLSMQVVIIHTTNRREYIVGLIEGIKNHSDSKVVAYCAAEVERQSAGPLFVAHMFVAWKYASNLGFVLNERHILSLGALVNGQESRTGYRQTPVFFARTGKTGVNHEHVPRLMTQLVNSKIIGTDEWVYEFLRIHPFEDGNGRVASLIHNWMSGTLDNPNPLPEYQF